jgi:hypothetical protein
MEEKRKSLTKKYRIATSTIVGVIELAYIAGIAIVLELNEGDCNTPLRLWLQFLLVAFSAHFLILFVSEILMPYCYKFLSGWICVVSASFNTFLGFFMVVWFILGNYWYMTSDSSCEIEFYEGKIAVFGILIVYYIFLGSACCIGCLLLVLISLGTGITDKAADY